MEQLVCSEEERARIESFKRERKMEFDRQEQQKQLEAERKGAEYSPQTYSEPSDADCLAVVRNGWKSHLDMMFEKKAKREGWSK